jgi:hypothetical protein
MKYLGVIILIMLFAGGWAWADDGQVPVTRQERENYNLGVDFVQTLARRGQVVNIDMVIKGMQDALQGGRSLAIEDREGTFTVVHSAEDTGVANGMILLPPGAKMAQAELSRSDQPQTEPVFHAVPGATPVASRYAARQRFLQQKSEMVRKVESGELK